MFAKLIKDRRLEDKWEVDSAALGPWHSGNSPDPRAMSTLKKHNVTYSHRARQVVKVVCRALTSTGFKSLLLPLDVCLFQITKDDFEQFDYIFGMDDENMSALNQKAPKNSKAELHLLGSFDPKGDRIIRDPYYVSVIA